MDIFTGSLVFIGSYLVGTVLAEVLSTRMARTVLFSLIGVLLLLGGLSILFK